MDDTADLARIAALVGDPARARMLTALMDGRALTATELAYLARITRPTARSSRSARRREIGERLPTLRRLRPSVALRRLSSNGSSPPNGRW